MQFDFDQLPPTERYEFLLGTVVPRPVALVTSLAPDGSLNAAPYSLFNVVSHLPPILMISTLAHPEGRMKDTATNILATREFVVSLVSEELADGMNTTCIDAPPGIDELQLAHLDTAPSTIVKPPRVAASPVAFECRLVESLSFGPNQAVIFGQVVSAYVADRFVLDAAKGLVDTPALRLIGAMHGAKWYAKLSDRFEMARPTWADRVRQRKTGP